jgi:hypothetical protein
MTSTFTPVAPTSVLGRLKSRTILAVAAGALSAFLSGCEGVPFYEKEHLSDPIMTLDGDPTETHFFQKVYYSREGSAGGIGTTAGGGCGCY